MKKFIPILVLFILNISTIICQFTIKSSDFENESMLNIKFTPYGEDVNPSLEWSNPPEGTKSFALICEDPDAPSGIFTHWAVKNIHKDIRMIKSNEKLGEEIRNSWGLKRYKGPRPPSGTHRYYFRLYALSAEYLSAKNAKELREQIKNNLLEEVSIMGKFESQNKKNKNKEENL